jgi:hypothetical protein
MRELHLSLAYISEGIGLFSMIPHCYDNKTNEMNRSGLRFWCGFDFHIKDPILGPMGELDLSPACIAKFCNYVPCPCSATKMTSNKYMEIALGARMVGVIVYHKAQTYWAMRDSDLSLE